MDATERRRVLLRRMAWLCAALVLTITSLSAFIRLQRAGLGCEPWPQCYGQAQREEISGTQIQASRQTDSSTQASAQVSAAASTSPATALARLAHRIAAVSALVLILLMAATALASTPRLWREGSLAVALLALALFLAAIGRWTTGARTPAPTLGNLLAGAAMFAIACRIARGGRRAGTGDAPGTRRLASWAWLGLALLVAQLALGALVSAGYAGLSCPELQRCDLTSASWQMFDPWHTSALDAAQPTHPQGAALQLVHRALALASGVVLLPVGLLAWRRGERAGLLLVVLLGLQLALGIGLVLGALPLSIALAHNVVAIVLLATALDTITGNLSG